MVFNKKILKVLNFFFLKKKTINFIKNGFFLDYGLKKFIKKFIYAVYVKLAYFFAEKYLIEYNTKLIFNFFSYKFFTFDSYFSTHKNVIFMVLFLINTLLILI